MQDRPTLARLLGVVRKNPGFRRLFAANAVSQMGDWFNVVALFSSLLELTGKGEAVAVVLLARLLPIFFVGPAAGVLADRISRRAIGHLLDRGVDPRALMAACGLVALVPAAFWASVQAAFRRAEPRDTAAA